MLLDTHVWLWLNADPARLSATLRRRLERQPERALVSAASTWEIAIKVGLGRLTLPEAPETWMPDRLRRTQVTPLAIEHSHAAGVASLPSHHRDPFDRLLVAQALALDVPLVTADPQLAAYDVEILHPT